MALYCSHLFGVCLPVQIDFSRSLEYDFIILNSVHILKESILTLCENPNTTNELFVVVMLSADAASLW